MNRSIGLLVLCFAVVVGLGTIPGCPKKDTKKDTTKVTPTDKDTDTPKKTESDSASPKKTETAAKFTLSVPAEYEIEIEKKTATVSVFRHVSDAQLFSVACAHVCNIAPCEINFTAYARLCR